MKSFIISPIHDPKGIYVPLMAEVEPRLESLKSPIIIGASENTHTETISYLKRLNLTIVPGNAWGEARINALKGAKKKGASQAMAMDFDKLLHWLKTQPAELEEYLNITLGKKCILGGRDESTWKSYPKSWQATEVPCNRLFEEFTGIKADILTAQLYLNEEAIGILAAKATDLGWGSCAEWPMILWKEGIEMMPKYFRGLDFEDRDKLKMTDAEINKLYDSKEEWEKRYRNQETIQMTIRKFGNS